jgi:hypothetical protein
LGSYVPSSDPADGLSEEEEEKEEADYYDYWDHMQLAYNYDWLDPDASGAHEAAFAHLAGWGPPRAREDRAERGRALGRL